MAASLEQILTVHGVDFRPSGRFELVVHCPLCGEADPSQHLSISTRRRGWRCLRNPRHRGATYARLLVHLLRCSEERARELLGEEATVLPDADEFASQWRKQLGLSAEASPLSRELRFPKEFRPLIPGAPRSAGFWRYLADRGYSEDQQLWISEAYKLHYALSERYAYRIIIPVYDRGGNLMTWTGRSIAKDADIRYLTLLSDLARAPPGALLLGLPLLTRANRTRCLVICEGPFDAIAVSAIGHERGIWGTCLFGLDLSNAQADLLEEIGDRFDKLRLLIDATAFLRILGMRSRLHRRCLPIRPPEGFKDPGEFVGSRRGEEFVLSLAN